jgi:hypothetical protein
MVLTKRANILPEAPTLAHDLTPFVSLIFVPSHLAQPQLQAGPLSPQPTAAPFAQTNDLWREAPPPRLNRRASADALPLEPALERRLSSKSSLTASATHLQLVLDFLSTLPPDLLLLVATARRSAFLPALRAARPLIAPPLQTFETFATRGLIGLDAIDACLSRAREINSERVNRAVIITDVASPPPRAR